MSTKILRVLALAVLVVVGSVAQSEAAPIVSVVPSSQTVLQGPVFVDIVVSNIDIAGGEEIGAFSLVLSYDSLILSGVSFLNNPDGEMGLGSDLSFGFDAWGAGTLDLFYSAEDFPPLGPAGDEAALQLLQSAGFFRLATISFNAIADGVSPLALSVVFPGGVFLSDGVGATLASTSVDGQVCVGANCQGQPAPIPEPGTLSLLGLGASALIARRRRAKARK